MHRLGWPRRIPFLTLAALEEFSRGGGRILEGEGKSTVLKLQANTASEAASQAPDARLRGERLAVVSAEEGGKWPLGLRMLVVVVLAAAAWLAVLYLPGLLTDLAGLALGLLLQAIS